MSNVKNNLVRKRQAVGMLFLVPALIMILGMTIIPIVWNLVLSFGEWKLSGEMTFYGLDNYRKIFQDTRVFSSLKNSVFVGIVSTIVAMVLGVGESLLIFHVSRKMGSFYRFVFFAPSMMPMTVIGILFVFVLSPDAGPLNGIFGALGLESLQHAWLAEPGLVLWVIAIVQGWRQSGVIMMLCFAAILSIPESLYESCELDGARYGRVVKDIILPLIKPTIQLALSMMLMWGFKTYDIVWAMTKGGPGALSKTAPIKMIELAFSQNQYGTSAAIGVVITIIVTILVIFARRVSKGETYEY